MLEDDMTSSDWCVQVVSRDTCEVGVTGLSAVLLIEVSLLGTVVELVEESKNELVGSSYVIAVRMSVLLSEILLRVSVGETSVADDSVVEADSEMLMVGVTISEDRMLLSDETPEE